MQNRRRIGGLFVVLWSVVLWDPHVLLGQCSLPIDEKAAPQAVVDVSLDRETVRPGEAPLVTFRITNRGFVPFYIPKTIETFDFRGGFQAIVTGPPHAKMRQSGGAADHFHYVDVAKEIGESWILLWPCDFYGGTRRLSAVPMSPGSYAIVGRRNPPRLGDNLKEKLRTTLKFPVLLDAIESQPIRLEVRE